MAAHLGGPDKLQDHAPSSLGNLALSPLGSSAQDPTALVVIEADRTGSPMFLCPACKTCPDRAIAMLSNVRLCECGVIVAYDANRDGRQIWTYCPTRRLYDEHTLILGRSGRLLRAETFFSTRTIGTLQPTELVELPSGTLSGIVVEESERDGLVAAAFENLPAILVLET